MKAITFIIHGKLRRHSKIIHRLREHFDTSYQLAFNITEHREHTIQLAARAVQAGSTHIICVGGDGTLNEAVNGVVQTLPETGQRNNIRIGLLPFGTGNDFARTLNLSRDIVALKKLIDNDSFHTLDLGLASFIDREGKKASRYFINITDVGIGGHIVRTLSESTKILGAFLTYQSAVIRAFFSFRKQPVRVVTDSWQYEGKAMELLFANGRYIGGGLCIAPHAKPDDGKFALVLGADISLWDYFRNVSDILKGKKIMHPEAHYKECTTGRVESLTHPLPIDMDGDFVGYTPLNIRIEPLAVRFVC